MSRRLRTAILAVTLLLVCGTTLPATAQGVPESWKEGELLPDFRLPDLDGGFIRLSAFRGQKVVLIHFASW